MLDKGVSTMGRMDSRGTPMTTVDMREYRRLCDDLRVAEKALCAPLVTTFPRDDGTVTVHSALSLLNQLRAEVANSSDRGGTGRNPRSLPLSDGAFDLLTDIGSWARYYCSRGSIEARIRHGVDLAASTVSDNQVAREMTRYLRQWEAAIHELINPPRRWHVAAPCPECRASTVLRYDTGRAQWVQHPALSVDPDEGCVCLACGTVWPPSHLELLAAVLGCDPVT